MNTRRNFFKRFAAIAAVVALAPEIAFRSKLQPWEISKESPVDTTYACVMESPNPKFTLYSETWAAIVCPDQVLMIENFST